jgi:hypothetical protein
MLFGARILAVIVSVWLMSISVFFNLILLFGFSICIFYGLWSSLNMASHQDKYIEQIIVNISHTIWLKKEAKIWRKTLSDLIKSDQNTDWLNNQRTIKISQQIKSSSLVVKNYAFSIEQLREQKFKFWWSQKSIELKWLIKKIIQKEKDELINIANLISGDIQSWISHHAIELAELEKQIECQEVSTENSDWKATLGLQRLSLQEHLKELQKVRV